MSRSFPVSCDCEADQMLYKLVHFSQTLDSSKQSFNEKNEVLCKAVADVEKLVSDVSALLPKGRSPDGWDRACEGVVQALNSISRTTRYMAETHPTVELTRRILNISEKLLQCHQVVLTEVQRAVTPEADSD